MVGASQAAAGDRYYGARQACIGASEPDPPQVAPHEHFELRVCSGDGAKCNDGRRALIKLVMNFTCVRMLAAHPCSSCCIDALLLPRVGFCCGEASEDTSCRARKIRGRTKSTLFTKGCPSIATSQRWVAVSRASGLIPNTDNVDLMIAPRLTAVVESWFLRVSSLDSTATVGHMTKSGKHVVFVFSLSRPSKVAYRFVFRTPSFYLALRAKSSGRPTLISVTRW